jgi:AbrB family looped-hinge helix DNA binding protein
MSVDVLTVSSKGQIVLPAPIRKALSIVAGDKLVAYSTGDSILLKKLELPKEDEFRKWLDDAQEWAAQSGLTEDDVPAIISEVRARKRS